ncbi:potassium channel family protein [Spiroplasma culicicola]|uniref:Potassium uptake protein KtrA n=1 Tax=Spiroplasma culicicola AES-1 TaxID=1276246 RepID=W6A5R2_9MOLU|nr:TrkA family potassium uptake protein [Spiroplasma culicicola]AHI52473.1 potassium uptake protein KtrA [Spiroplasma culicicola AES-1]
MAKKKSFAIIGANHFGLSVAQTLDEKKQHIKIFDINEEKLNLYVSEFESVEAIVLDTTNKNALERNGISQFDCVIVCFGSSMEASILTVLNLIDLGVENITVNARDKHHKRILLALGIEEDKVIIPDVMTGKLVATKSLFDIEGDVQSTDGEYSFTSIQVLDENVIDKTISENGLSTNKDFNIVQIKRNGKVVIPDEYTTLKEEDILIVFAKNTMINDLVIKIRGEIEEE